MAADEEPRPLALEGPSDKDKSKGGDAANSAEIDIDVKKKPQDKKTTINFKDNSFLKKVIETPKEQVAEQGEIGGGGGGSSSSSSAPPPPSSEGPPKEDLNVVRERLLSEQQSYESEKPTPEECEDSADFMIELVDTILMFVVQIYSLDSSDKEYQIEEKRKNKLKKHLAKILIRMGKRYPLGMMFVVMLVASYFPMLRKAHTHRTQVQEEKAQQAKDKAAAAGSGSGGGSGPGPAGAPVGNGGGFTPPPTDGGRRRRRRRASEMIEDVEFEETRNPS